MKRSFSASALTLGGLLLLSLSAPTYAQNNPLITVDENGNGTLDFSAVGGPVLLIPGNLAADPGPGGLPLALTYNLGGPPALVAGDVFMQDGVGGPILDVVRFNPAGTGGDPAYPASLVFYSDNTDGFDALGDTASPPTAFYTNTITIQEVGTEANNGAFYTPGPNDPGFVPGFSVSYHFISDVPEPGAYALIGSLGVTGAAFLRRKRARKSA